MSYELSCIILAPKSQIATQLQFLDPGGQLDRALGLFQHSGMFLLNLLVFLLGQNAFSHQGIDQQQMLPVAASPAKPVVRARVARCFPACLTCE
jgi:hypothetical protein